MIWLFREMEKSTDQERFMAGNSYGQQFRITTAGESHGRGNVVIIDFVATEESKTSFSESSYVTTLRL